MRNKASKAKGLGAVAFAILFYLISGAGAWAALTGQAEPLKATGDENPPKRVKSVEPVYPEDARKNGIEGIVVLEATVDVKGVVEKVKVLNSIPALDQAAIDAVKKWVYEPKVINGKPVPVVFTVTVRFVLK
jgi:TonB family protein